MCVFSDSLAMVPTVDDVIARTSEGAPHLVRDAIALQYFSKHGCCTDDLFPFMVQRSSYFFLLSITIRLPAQFLLLG